MQQSGVHILIAESSKELDPAADRLFCFLRIAALQPFCQPTLQLLRDAERLIGFVGAQPFRFKNRSFANDHAVVSPPHRQVIMLRKLAVILEHFA
ncbi:hypothetical protein D3C76_1688070 [compost metagenome]